MSSKRRWRHFASDIVAAIDSIKTFTSGKSSTDLAADELLRSAVAYQLAIVGEALRQIELSAPIVAQALPVREAWGLRIILTHRYFDSNAAIIWQTVQEDLDPLRDKVQAILSQEA